MLNPCPTGGVFSLYIIRGEGKRDEGGCFGDSKKYIEKKL